MKRVKQRDRQTKHARLFVQESVLQRDRKQRGKRDQSKKERERLNPGRYHVARDGRRQKKDRQIAKALSFPQGTVGFDYINTLCCWLASLVSTPLQNNQTKHNQAQHNAARAVSGCWAITHTSEHEPGRAAELSETSHQQGRCDCLHVDICRLSISKHPVQV